MPVAVHIITAVLDNKQKEFIEYVLSRYIETGVEELDQEKLPILLTNKYQSLEDAKEILGDVASISRLFIEFQQHLYKQNAAWWHHKAGIQPTLFSYTSYAYAPAQKK